MVGAYLWLMRQVLMREAVLFPRLIKVNYTSESSVTKNEALRVKS